MAFKIPGLKAFSAVDAKSRMFILFAAVVGISLAVYLGVHFLGRGGTAATARVAPAPAGMVSVPGGETSAEYERTQAEASRRRLEEARQTGAGTSAISTVTNAVGFEAGCYLCPSEENPDVATDIDDLVNKGKVTREAGDLLKDLANRNVSVDEYAAALDALVKAGKLTPEEARLLLEKYKKQHANALVNDSAKTMDTLIKAGNLPLSAANELLDLQRGQLTPEEYAAELQRLVREGKISPETAATLLAQYTQQRAKEAAKVGDFKLREMAKAGQVTPDVLKSVQEMQKNNVPLNEYTNALNKMVADGKITPAVAKQLIDQYRTQRMGGPGGPLADLIAKGGKAEQLANQLLTLKANNASLADYTDELKKGVQAGIITPAEAAALLAQYQAGIAPVPGVAPGAETVTPEYAALQERLAATAAPPPAPETFENVEVQEQAQLNQERLKRIQDLQQAMAGQAQNLVNNVWQPANMSHSEGSYTKAEEEAANGGSPPTEEIVTGISKPALIKAGAILFGVLDTAVDSDYPDTPVMVTLIEGKFKGAKLLGRLSLAQGQNKLSLNFTQMDMEGWPSAKSISAYAIDPDTARTVMASEVNNHYLQKWGLILATSFLQGYSSAITNAGTSTTGIFGTSSTHPELNPGSKIAVGLGQIGTNLNQIALEQTNMPATVKIYAGVGLGILFTAEVTDQGIPPLGVSPPLSGGEVTAPIAPPVTTTTTTVQQSK